MDYIKAGKRAVAGIANYIGTDDPVYARQVEDDFAKRVAEEIRSIAEGGRLGEVSRWLNTHLADIEENPAMFTGTFSSCELTYYTTLATLLVCGGMSSKEANELVEKSRKLVVMRHKMSGPLGFSGNVQHWEELTGLLKEVRAEVQKDGRSTQ